MNKYLILILIFLIIMISSCTSKSQLTEDEKIKEYEKNPEKSTVNQLSQTTTFSIAPIWQSHPQCVGGATICIDTALYCLKPDLTRTLVNPTHKLCGWDPNPNNIGVISSINNPPPLFGSCVSTSSQNNPSDSNRINLVFIGANYDDFEQFKFFVESSIDYDANFYGLLSVEPFKSNKHKFNFWYLDTMAKIPYEEQETKIPDSRLRSTIIANTIVNFIPALSCPLEKTYFIALINERLTPIGTNPALINFQVNDKIPGNTKFDCNSFDADSDGCIDDNDRALLKSSSLLNLDDPIQHEALGACLNAQYGCVFSSQVDSRVVPYRRQISTVVHEFGHTFAGLTDEYDAWGDKDAFEHAEEKTFGTNCYIASTEADCKTNSPWAVLYGGGCGRDGIIDCNEQDKFYTLEVGCFEGCAMSQKGIFRPTRNSIMNSPFGPDPVYSFGLVNERVICNKIEQLTGSADGYCERF